jgi:hypothetical protein
MICDTHAVLWTNDYQYNPKTPFIIDLDDVERVKEYIFTEYGDGYAYDYKAKVFLHRVVFNADSTQVLKMKDGNKRNCRKSNIILYKTLKPKQERR